MTGTLFIILLSVFASLSALVVEAIKTAYKSIKGKKMKASVSCICALIVSFIVGCGGSLIWYITKAVDFNSVNITYIFLMGLSVTLVSQVGYDKVHEIVQKFIE